MYVEESPISFAYAVLSVCLLGFVAEICAIYEGRKVAKLTEPQAYKVKTSEMFEKSSEVRLSGLSLWKLCEKSLSLQISAMLLNAKHANISIKQVK